MVLCLHNARVTSLCMRCRCRHDAGYPTLRHFKRAYPALFVTPVNPACAIGDDGTTASTVLPHAATGYDTAYDFSADRARELSAIGAAMFVQAFEPTSVHASPHNLNAVSRVPLQTTTPVSYTAPSGYVVPPAAVSAPPRYGMVDMSSLYAGPVTIKHSVVPEMSAALPASHVAAYEYAVPPPKPVLLHKASTGSTGSKDEARYLPAETYSLLPDPSAPAASAAVMAFASPTVASASASPSFAQSRRMPTGSAVYVLPASGNRL